mgnify:FL=1
MNKKKDNRGGKRPGAGRPKKDPSEKRVKVSITMRPDHYKETRGDSNAIEIELDKAKKITMTHTCEFPHPEYGTLILSGQIFEAEPECYLEAHAMLDSAMTYDGEEMLTYANGNPIGFTQSDISEMESALLHRGERANRVKPTPKLLQFLRDEMLNV